jgi:hypothetical protein
MSTTRLAGLYAMVAAAMSLAFAPILALSYFAIEEGAEELNIGTVAAWAEPARELAGGLLTRAQADRVAARPDLPAHARRQRSAWAQQPRHRPIVPRLGRDRPSPLARRAITRPSSPEQPNAAA